MIIVNRIEDIISGSVNGVPYGVSFDDQKYEKMMELKDRADKALSMDDLKAIVEEFIPLTQESYKDTVETMSPYIFVNKHTNKFYLRWNNTEISNRPLPAALADKIIKSTEKNIDVTPLIKMWVRFLRNPNYTDAKAKLVFEYISAPYVNDELVAELTSKKGLNADVARKMATTTQVSITQEGLLVGYKVSKEVRTKFVLDNETEEVKTRSRYNKKVDPDTGLVSYDEPEYAEERLFEPAIMGQGGDEFFSDDKKGHFIRVGKSHFLDSWDKVNCIDNVTGAPGLHVGGLRYIQGYQNGTDRVTHNVFIDPMHIGAVTGLGFGNDGAIRVKQYFVHSTFNGVNKNIYHSSTYAATTDAEYADMVKEAVAASQMKKEEVDKMMAEQSAIA